MWEDAPTFDEVIAPSVGYAELFTRDYSLVDDHPPLYRTFIALPLLAFQPVLPLGHDSWRKRQRGMQDRYSFSHQFLYVVNRQVERFLFWSRLPVVFFSVVLALLVFQWSKALYGPPAGLFALFLYVFEPNIIAHSRFTTNDLISTLFIFATVYQFWRYHEELNPRYLVLAGLLFGGALLSKFSALMLIPMLFLLAIVVSMQKNRDGMRLAFTPLIRNFRVLARQIARTLGLLMLPAVALIFVFYGAQWRLFFESAYNAVAHYRGGHSAFLLGNYSLEGWWYYFPVAFGLKTPVPLLIFIFSAFAFRSFRSRRGTYFLFVPLGVILLIALRSHINIGLRHILPAYPFLIVLASSIVTIRFSKPAFFRMGIGALLLWCSYSTISSFPGYLAYFNEFVPSGHEHRVLVDSNLDWGQDLQRLKKFLDRKGIARVYLSYFGTADPCYYGIRFLYLPGSPLNCRENPVDGAAEYVAVSATNLQSVYLPYKSTYEWLKNHEPVARIGTSIFVYNIGGDASAHTNLGILYLKYRMLMPALREFRKAAELAPQDARAHANLGLAYKLLSMREMAAASFIKALSLSPGLREARKGLKELQALPAKE